MRLPSVLVVVVVGPAVPACTNDKKPIDTSSSCQSCSTSNQASPCGEIPLFGTEQTCPQMTGTVCQCDAVCLGPNFTLCNGVNANICAGSNGSCPDGCEYSQQPCAIA